MRSMTRCARIRAAVSTVFTLCSLPFAAWGQTPTPAAPSFDPKAWLLPLDEEATLGRDAEGDVVFQWTAENISAELQLTDDPLKLPGDAGPVLATVKGKKKKDIKGYNASGRWYGVITFRGGANDGKRIVVADRRLPLLGAANFRDIGGYRTVDQRQVRWGRLYRAEALAGLTDSDLATVGKLGLKTLCDFRGVTERAAAPDKLPSSVTLSIAGLPIESGAGRGDAMKMLGVALKGDPAALDATMSALYIQMAEEHGKDAFGPFITLAADTKNLPMVYHCTAGKDRTGIATALILRVLGVPEKMVVADYSQSNLAYDSLMKQVRGNPQLAALGVSPERLGPLMGVNPVWLTNALRHIETKYGSVENYLTTACGVEKKTLDSLRKTLLY